MDMRSYDEKVDVYAFGIFMWELLMRQPPFEGKEVATMMQIVGGGTVKRPTVPSFCPPLYAALMTRCWAQKARDRPSCEQIMASLDKVRAEEGDFVSPNSLPQRIRKPFEKKSGFDAEE